MPSPIRAGNRSAANSGDGVTVSAMTRAEETHAAGRELKSIAGLLEQWVHVIPVPGLKKPPLQRPRRREHGSRAPSACENLPATPVGSQRCWGRFVTRQLREADPVARLSRAGCPCRSALSGGTAAYPARESRATGNARMPHVTDRLRRLKCRQRFATVRGMMWGPGC